MAKEDLLERLKREVTEQALAVIACDQFESWLASYAAHEGNDYVRKDHHEHTYNSTHHRVVTYGCNHSETKPKQKLPSAADESLVDLNDNEANQVTGTSSGETGTQDEEEFEIIGCDAILDIYYFYESSVYQIIQLGEHEHPPMNIPQQFFGTIPGITPLNGHPAS